MKNYFVIGTATSHLDSGNKLRQQFISISRYIFSVGLWILVVLLIIEVFLRIFVETPPATYAYDPNWGWQPAAGNTIVWGTEGFGHTYYSDHGELATPYDIG
ncbi:MAG: hypothetical protein KDJ65_14800 [Anaerolineae bacterium]|nr:hypothetical protein [Anaerolineae bacterium]